VKGDRVEIVVAADDGSRTYEIVATRAGRRIEITSGRGIVEVLEVTRTGEPVRRARFMASRVLALGEHPASEARTRQEPPADGAAGAQSIPRGGAVQRMQGRIAVVTGGGTLHCSREALKGDGGAPLGRDLQHELGARRVGL